VAAIDANLASAAAARGAGSVSEELHASDYLTYAYLQTGRDADALRLRDALAAIQARFDPSATGSAAPASAGFFAVAAIPARYALERGDWAAAAALETHDSPVPFADAISDFARGLGAARSGKPAVAAAAAAHVETLRETLAAAHEAYWTEQLAIQHQELLAWIAFADARRDEAVEKLRAAAVREDATEKNAITPGPLAPGRELLGEMLLELGRPAEALTEFETALLHEPNRFRSLDGAARSAAKAADTAKATKYYAALLEVCAKAETPGRPALVEARAWMKNHPARLSPPRLRDHELLGGVRLGKAHDLHVHQSRRLPRRHRQGLGGLRDALATDRPQRAVGHERRGSSRDLLQVGRGLHQDEHDVAGLAEAIRDVRAGGLQLVEERGVLHSVE
jgi:tetratricopeptide (TPR) repeat protein